MKVDFGTRAKRLASVESLLPVGGVLGEVLRVFPWIVFLSAFGRLGFATPPLGLLSSLAIVAVTAFVVRRSVASGWSIGSARVLTMSVAMALLLVLARLENGGGYAFFDMAWGSYAINQLPALGAALGFGLILIWRGITIGRESLGIEYLYRNFKLSIIGFVVLMVLWGLTIGFNGGEDMFKALVPYVLAYFFVALMTLGISNFLSIRQGTVSRPRATDLFARRWLLVLLAVVLVVVLVGGIVGSTVSYNLVGVVSHGLSTLGDWLLTAVKYLIGYPIGYLLIGVEWLGKIIIAWIQSLMGKPYQVPPEELGGGPPEMPDLSTGSLPPGLLLAIKWVLVALAVAVLVYVLARLISRYWREPREKGFEEVNESLFSWNGFRADLKSFLKGLLKRRPATAPAVPPIAATINGEEQYLDIRELYRGLLWEGEQAGHPKAKWQTPYEYQRALGSFFPDEHDGLAEITGTYVEHRYGHVPVASELGRRLMKVWLRLRAALRGTADGQATTGAAPK